MASRRARVRGLPRRWDALHRPHHPKNKDRRGNNRPRARRIEGLKCLLSPRGFTAYTAPTASFGLEEGNACRGVGPLLHLYPMYARGVSEGAGLGRARAGRPGAFAAVWGGERHWERLKAAALQGHRAATMWGPGGPRCGGSQANPQPTTRLPGCSVARLCSQWPKRNERT